MKKLYERLFRSAIKSIKISDLPKKMGLHMGSHVRMSWLDDYVNKLYEHIYENPHEDDLHSTMKELKYSKDKIFA